MCTNKTGGGWFFLKFLACYLVEGDENTSESGERFAKRRRERAN